MNRTIAKAACAVLITSAPLAGAGAALTALTAGAASAQPAAGFTAIGARAEYRIDGLRDGVHNGAPVRFLDVTLRNLHADTTFAGSIQEVWWQGRGVGGEAKALQRSGQPFGMHDQYIKQGQTVAVSYPIPARPDVSGVTIEYPKPDGGPKKRAFTFAELAAAGTR
jgi:hypothetical protein